MRYPSASNLSRSTKAALLGSTLGMLCGIGHLINKAHYEISAASLEVQVESRYWDTRRYESSCDNSPLFKDECLHKIAGSRRCVRRIQELIGIPIEPARVAQDFDVPDLKGHEDAVLALDECAFAKPLTITKWASNVPAEFFAVPILGGIAGALLLGATSLFALWIFDYPHLGWKRLIVIVSPLIGLLVGIWFNSREGDSLSSVCAGLAALAGAAILLVVGREAFLWVKDGFSKESKNG